MMMQKSRTPRPTPDALQTGPDSQPLPAAVPGLAGKRVLTIDDQPTSTRMIRLALQTALGMVVREVNEPARALDVALEFRPDLVLLDIEMPGMSGGIVWRQFRSHPDFRKVPVVFLTSRISQEEASPNSPDASTHMLAKPVTLATLAERVTTLLAPRSKRRPSP